MPRYDFDLFTIGAGSGGVAGSRRAAAYGARVAICEELRVGGTCVLRGCVPKKLLVYGAQFADAFADAAGFGWTVPPARFDWPSLIAAKDNEIGRLSQIYINMLNNSGVEIIDGRGVVVRSAYGRGRRANLYRRQDHDRGRRASDRAQHSRHRACDLVERGARPAPSAAPHRDRRRRLYRRRVRRHLQRLRLGGRRDHPARGTALRLRRRFARGPGAGDARPRHRDPHPHPDRPHRQGAARGLLGLHHPWPGNLRRPGHVRDRPQAEYARARPRRDRRRDEPRGGCRSRRMAALDRAQHLRGRRRDRSAQPDPGGDRRRPRHRRDPLQQQPDQDGPQGCADRRVQPAADRHGRADRGGSAARTSARSISTAPASSR